MPVSKMLLKTRALGLYTDQDVDNVTAVAVVVAVDLSAVLLMICHIAATYYVNVDATSDQCYTALLLRLLLMLWLSSYRCF